jgi:hypothetical protein
MDEVRRAKIAKTEALYRSVNEKIEDMNAAFGVLVESMLVICECGDSECAEQIELDIPLYARVRADGTLFVVKTGHEIPDVEKIVERHEGFSIVCKDKEPGASVALETDPRA